VYIPDHVVQSIEACLQREQVKTRDRSAIERANLEKQLAALLRRMDAAYTDKLDGRISEEFWSRTHDNLQQEQIRLKSLISGQDKAKQSDRILDVKGF
jgi:hypothetical protein